ncbi:MAG: hypothetical protein J07HB67_01805, partial [halophilic archaeon J07HB67]
MSLVVDTAYAVAAAAGVGLIGVAVHLAERDVLGSRALAWFFGLLGVGSSVTGAAAAAGVVPSPPGLEFPGVIFATAAVVGVTSVPMSVFALQYTGRTRQVGRRLVVAAGAVLSGVAVWFVVVWTRPESGLRVATNVWWSFLSLAVVVVAVYTLAETTDGRVLDTAQTVGLLVPVVAVNTGWRFVTLVSVLVGQPGVAVCIAATPVVSLLSAVAVFARRDPFATLPATRRIGRQAAIRETDDLLVVADDDDTIVETNAATDEVVDTAVGGTVTELLGATTDELARAETVRLPDG